MKLLLALTFLPCVAFAQLGSLSLPAAPQWPPGQDRIRSADGVQCETSTTPRKWFMDIGVLGGRGNGLGSNNQGTVIDINSQFINNQYERNTYAIYARVVINLDSTPPKMNCNELYALEIQRLRSEIEYLQMGQGVAGSVVVK